MITAGGNAFRIAVLTGGTSPEREVSLASGRACATALARHFPTRLVDVTSDELPAEIDPDRDVIFSTLHGVFGEDGGMQQCLERARFVFAGCDAASSELTFDKQRTKIAAVSAGVASPRGWVFSAEEKPVAAALTADLGENVVLKPNRSGSSVGLHMCVGEEQVATALKTITEGQWLAEEQIEGREITVGVLEGRAMGVVEITPKSGVYDYVSKYTKGMTKYVAPAPIEASLERSARESAEAVFAACGCRDYARIDFMITNHNELNLLEINTLPGMTETSLLPMSATCGGLDFTALVGAMVAPAIARFRVRSNPVAVT